MRVGAPDESLTRFSGLAAVSELTDRLGVIDRLDAAVGPIKARGRGFTAGQVLVGKSSPRSCAARTSWSGWTGTAPMSPGRR
ncbi:hypothetical protein [Pseudonocardia asaccharolytica]|uniref:Uncharacterized protein n=1 Tax=Pseudonocardia asaccharolytica DSM 44247 = NBRC 16224 TaxID=1123024 RepID=A0A511DB86_9PSEU|nr:hypothetical protein [Pseudonocardia asaccharolytica]GEL20924.1 hypothetical protein PA7_47610 [Pseudonocardia asaccharolytica DSM 44247 = NBRC 16224]